MLFTRKQALAFTFKLLDLSLQCVFPLLSFPPLCGECAMGELQLLEASLIDRPLLLVAGLLPL